MKKIILIYLLIISANYSNAQAFEKGSNVINLGYGLDPYYVSSSSSIGPFFVGYERGITDVIGIGRFGVGGAIAHSIYSYAYFGGTERGSRFSPMLKVAYHFDFDIEKMDLYAGVGAAAHFYNVPNYINYNNNGNAYGRDKYLAVGHYIFAGIRYYFTDNFGVYAEAGHGASALNGGIVFKF